MKKIFKTLFIIPVILITSGFTYTIKSNNYSDTSKIIKMKFAEKKMEITGNVPDEIMEYCKESNPNIKKQEVKGLLAQRNYVHKLHKDFEQYQEDIGIMVDVEKNPDKEPIPLQNLPYETQKEHNEKLKKIWDEEIRFLEMRRDKRMISNKHFKEDYKTFKKIRAELDNF